MSDLLEDADGAPYPALIQDAQALWCRDLPDDHRSEVAHRIDAALVVVAELSVTDPTTDLSGMTCCHHCEGSLWLDGRLTDRLHHRETCLWARARTLMGLG